MICVGIDNGIKGGIAIIRDDGLELSVMPITKEFGKNKVDVFKLRDIIAGALRLEDFQPLDYFVAYERPGGSQSASAAASMAASFSAVDTVLKLLGVRRKPLLPSKWQPHYWGKVDDTKAEALRVAKELWPEQSWLASARSSKPHDGLVDAALIANWASLHKGSV